MSTLVRGNSVRNPFLGCVISASISAGSVELLSGSFLIGDGEDSMQRADRRRERADLFCLFHAPLPQAHIAPTEKKFLSDRITSTSRPAANPLDNSAKQTISTLPL